MRILKTLVKTLGCTIGIFIGTFIIYTIIVLMFYQELNPDQQFDKAIGFMQSWFFVITVIYWWKSVYKSFSQEDAR